MWLDKGTTAWPDIYVFKFCTIEIVTCMDIYGFDTDVAGNLHIEKFVMVSAITAFGQSTVTHSSDLRIGLLCLSVISVMNRFLSVIVRIRAYLVRMAFSNMQVITYRSDVLLRTSTMIFHPWLNF